MAWRAGRWLQALRPLTRVLGQADAAKQIASIEVFQVQTDSISRLDFVELGGPIAVERGEAGRRLRGGVGRLAALVVGWAAALVEAGRLFDGPREPEGVNAEVVEVAGFDLLGDADEVLVAPTCTLAGAAFDVETARRDRDWR